MALAQIPLSQWPLGLEHDGAFLTIAPADLQERLGLIFEADDDDDGLGTFDAAIVQLPAGNLAALQHHRRAPVFGTTVIVAALDRTMVREILATLQVSSGEICWLNPLLQPRQFKPINRRLGRRGDKGPVERMKHRMAARKHRRTTPEIRTA